VAARANSSEAEAKTWNEKRASEAKANLANTAEISCREAIGVAARATQARKDEAKTRERRGRGEFKKTAETSCSEAIEAAARASSSEAAPKTCGERPKRKQEKLPGPAAARRKQEKLPRPAAARPRRKQENCRDQFQRGESRKNPTGEVRPRRKQEKLPRPDAARHARRQFEPTQARLKPPPGMRLGQVRPRQTRQKPAETGCSDAIAVAVRANSSEAEA
jgi:hypothetical protein